MDVGARLVQGARITGGARGAGEPIDAGIAGRGVLGGQKPRCAASVGTSVPACDSPSACRKSPLHGPSLLAGQRLGPALQALHPSQIQIPGDPTGQGLR